MMKVTSDKASGGWRGMLLTGAVVLFIHAMAYQYMAWMPSRALGDPLSPMLPYWITFLLCWIALGWFLRSANKQTIKSTERGAVWCLLFIAFITRLTMCGTSPVLSDDIWRYIHDGAVLGGGGNPYLQAPADIPDELMPVPGVAERINNVELVTIYQPTSQWVFAGLDRVWESLPEGLQRFDPGHDKVFRLGFVFFDLAIIGLILFQLRSMGRSAWWAVAYAWHPLAISEVAGSGHQDVIGIAFLLLSLVLAGRLVKSPGAGDAWCGEESGGEGLNRQRLLMTSGDYGGGFGGGAEALSRKRLWVAVGAGVAFGLAVGVKPLVLPIAGVLAWVLRGRPKVVMTAAGATVLTGVALYLPFALMDGGLAGMIETTRTFVDKWAFNGSVYTLVSTYILGKPWVDYLAMAVLLAVVVLSLSRRFTGREPDAMRTAGAFMFASLLLSSTVHPWYLLWALALLPMYFSPALWVFSLVVVASYAAHLYEGYRVPTWVVVLEYLPVYLGLAWSGYMWLCRRQATGYYHDN